MSLVYNTTKRHRNSWVNRDEYGDHVFVVGAAAASGPSRGRPVILAGDGGNDSREACYGPGLSQPGWPSPGAYHVRNRSEPLAREPGKHGSFAHGRVVVGRKKLVNKDVKRGFRRVVEA